MAIKITVGDDAVEQEQPSPIVTNVELQIRRSMNGDYYISDHSDIDIILLKDKQKVLVIAKDLMSELVYGAQDRLFGFLKKKGLVTMGSVRGGNAYGSIEGEIPVTNHPSPIKLIMLNISKWVDEERPYFETMDHLEDMEEEHFTSPEEEDSTALGDVPHEDKKGAMITGLSVMHSPFYYNYYLQEDKER